MSILLDALRKSEKDQQKFEAPGIHSGEQSKPASGFFKKRWLLLLIVVVFASSSFAWYQYRKPEETYEPAAKLASGASSEDEQQSSEPTGKADNGKRLAAVARDTAKKSRTPVEAYQVSDGGNKKPAAKSQTTKKQASNKQAANQKANGKPAANKSTTAKSAESSQKPFRPQQPAPINYWELPDAIRAKVPEMKFTVLVYAKDPADRFVLIDGQRYGQGEQVQPDLFIREIRRKGVVFKYRLYKFLVER